ncbi:MAG: hypothetical protein HC883_01105 [Bdellovibrionaceae bacterium]|nr:hypothetical protein [Pseudobdellovibrionaceae bacterium]
MHAHHEFTPNFLPFQITKRRLTSAAGLATLIEAFDQSTLKKPFCEALPERTSPRSLGSYRLGVIQLASFMRGHDCLADIEEFRKDPMLMEVLRGDIVSPRTMGDFCGISKNPIWPRSILFFPDRPGPIVSSCTRCSKSSSSRLWRLTCRSIPPPMCNRA